MEDTSQPVALRARRRIARRILPYLFLLYIVAFLDRVNLSYASLRMTGDLGFSDEVYGFGAGVFFLGYVLLEIPGSLIVERWSARAWIARIMVTWGLVASCLGLIGAIPAIDRFVSTRDQFYVLRFVLGAAEAGFFPGVIVYLGHWFRYRERAKAIALFMAAIPVSSVVGAPISGYLLRIDWLGLQGWRWLFLIEGVPSVLLGLVTLVFLTDRPHQAAWLADDERAWIAGELDRERRARDRTRSYGALEAMRNRHVIVFTAVYFLAMSGGYGFIFWLPKLVKGSLAVSDQMVTIVCAGVYAVALLAMIATGWSSDRRGERRLHAGVWMLVGSAGFVVAALAGNHPALVIVALLATGAAVHSYLPPFWALPTTFLTGTAAAAAIGLINSIGNLGGFLGPYAIGAVTSRTGSSVAGLLFVAALALAGGLLLLLSRFPSPATMAEAEPDAPLASVGRSAEI